jgi:hypothetical protein
VKYLAEKGCAAALLFLLVMGASSRAETRGDTPFPQPRLSPWGEELLLKKPGGGIFLQFSALPVQGKITSFFGPRRSPKRGASRWHKGIDISAPRGTPVAAVAPGLVAFQGRDKAYGKTIVLDHGDGLITRYAHLDGYTVNKGSRVEAGQTIGTVGRTGRATGCNLHFETVLDGVPRDPLNPSLWAASLPKMEVLPRLLAAQGRNRSLSAAPARSSRQQGAPGEVPRKGKNRPSFPIAGMNAASQSRASAPPRGDILP